MSYKPREIYKGRRKFRVPLIILLFTVAFLFIAAVGLFYGLQQFIVYDQNGVTLQFSKTETETETTETESLYHKPDVSGLNVQLVFLDPDFSDVNLVDTEEYGKLRAVWIPAETTLSSVKLAAALVTVDADSCNTVVLEMKSSGGQLAWSSNATLAVNYGTTGYTDFSEIVAQLHEKGLRAAAAISCCADTLMGMRNWPIALLTPLGAPYTDADGVYWLDPYNRSVREYLIEMMTELAQLGFDEIILTNLSHPVSEEGFVYSTTLRTEPNPTAAIGQLAVKCAEAMAEYDVAVSACLNQSSLREGLAEQTGQDVDLFWRCFDRLYCFSDSDNADGDLSLATAFGGETLRFVPVCADAAPEGFPSYALYLTSSED